MDGNIGAWIFLVGFCIYTVISTSWNSYLCRQFSKVSKEFRVFAIFLWLVYEFSLINMLFAGIFDGSWPNREISVYMHFISSAHTFIGNVISSALVFLGIALIYWKTPPRIRQTPHPFKFFLVTVEIVGVYLIFEILGGAFWEWILMLSLLTFMIFVSFLFPENLQLEKPKKQSDETREKTERYQLKFISKKITALFISLLLILSMVFGLLFLPFTEIDPPEQKNPFSLPSGYNYFGKEAYTTGDQSIDISIKYLPNISFYSSGIEESRYYINLFNRFDSKSIFPSIIYYNYSYSIYSERKTYYYQNSTWELINSSYGWNLIIKGLFSALGNNELTLRENTDDFKENDASWTQICNYFISNWGTIEGHSQISFAINSTLTKSYFEGFETTSDNQSIKYIDKILKIQFRVEVNYALHLGSFGRLNRGNAVFYLGNGKNEYGSVNLDLNGIGINAI